jgi:glutaredoxin-like YruB-family protein
MKDKNIIVYSTPSCPYCVMAKTFLKERNIPFEDVDVSRDRARAMEMVEKSGQMGVPVIDIDNNILVGFQPNVMVDLLGLNK